MESLHCMICIEEFSCKDRPPVVLPCGHTYICLQCAERLDKCMECRMPLFMAVPKPSAAAPHHHPNDPVTPSRYSARSPSTRYHNHQHHHHDPTTPKATPQPPVKRRLPLPKNVVLLSLIEAAELAAREAAEIRQNRLTGSPADASVVGMEDEEKIRQGTSLAISESGTYSVAIKEGLQVYPSIPTDSTCTPMVDDDECDDSDNHNHNGGSSRNYKNNITSDDDDDGGEGDQQEHEVSAQSIDSVVQFFHMEHKMENVARSNSIRSVGSNNGSGRCKMDTNDDGNEGLLAVQRLNYGDRVQVVSTTADGWAKLARGYGYVRSGNQQLVKVGSPTDRACKLEALMRLLASQNERLKRDQKKVESRFLSLMKELQTSLLTDEDLTIFVPESLNSDIEVRDEGDGQEVRLGEARPKSPPGLNHTPLKPRPMERPITPPVADAARGFFCSTDVFENVMPITPSMPGTAPILPSSSVISGARSGVVQSALPAMIQRTASNEQRIFRTTSQPTGSSSSPGSVRNHAQVVWREMRDRPVGIDFRTGMSGHHGLSRTHTHPHDFLESSRSRTEYLGMSNHTGLTMWKPTRKFFSNTFLGATSFGSSSSPPRPNVASENIPPGCAPTPHSS